MIAAAAARIDGAWRAVPAELRFAIVLLIATRAVLTVIGVASRPVFMPLVGAKALWNFSPHLWLDIWGVYDTQWYLDIARRGYSTQPIGQFHATNYAFFPAYPILVRTLGALVQSDYVAGLIISNACLVIACVGLYRLTLLDSDAPTALRAVKYMVLFPSAFILSAVLSESLFLALLVWCFYFARTRRWPAAGMAGCALALARPLGVIVWIPLLFEYAVQAGWDFRRVKPDVVFLVLVPLGLAAFAAYNYRSTGDALAFVHTQARWYKQFSDPLGTLIEGLTVGRTLRAPVIFFRFGAYFTIAALAMLAISYRTIRTSYWVTALGLLLLPLATGTTALPSMPRFSLVAFPLYVVLARAAASNGSLDQMLAVSLALLQGFLMACWTNWIQFVI